MSSWNKLQSVQLPSMSQPENSSSKGSADSVVLPPISFLSNLPSLKTSPEGQQRAPGAPGAPADGSEAPAGSTAAPAGSTAGPAANGEASKLETDDEIIKYYEHKYNIFDFTSEEKHDIIQHEKRARIEKARNPNYKTFLCYSIIKRLNAIKPASPSRPAGAESTTTTAVAGGDKAPREVKKFQKKQVSVDNKDVLEFASKFPRYHLGSLLYTPTPTADTYKELSISGWQFKSGREHPPLLPELRGYINSIITVRIPSQFITDIQNNPHYVNRAIWGTDVYTDDSDVLNILKHNGFLPHSQSELGELGELRKDEAQVQRSTPGNKDNAENIKQTVNNLAQFVNIVGGDIHVDLIILPPLASYRSLYRNGLNSREWTTPHDGMSIAVYGVRYGEVSSAVDSINSAGIKKRRIDELVAMSEQGGPGGDDGTTGTGWKLSFEAWRKIKAELDEKKKTGVSGAASAS